jgi:hypothetical protein
MTRRRWYYTRGGKPCEPYEAQGPDVPARLELMTGTFYDGTVATDGTDLGSRRKHQEYMRVHDLAMASDFAHHWQKSAAEREALYKGEHDVRPIREAVERAFYETTERKR